MAKTLEAGKLVVGAVAVYLDPTGTAATALGIDTTLQLRTWFSKLPDIAKLSRELDKKFNDRLKDARFNKPEEARVLIPQMLEASVVTGKGIAECGLDPDLIFTRMKETIQSQSQEYNRIEVLQAFEDLVLPLLREACNDLRLKAAIDPDLIRQQMKSQRDMLERQAEMESKIDRLLAQNEGLIGVIRQLAEGKIIDADALLTLPEMKMLAQRFGETEIDDRGELLRFLALKAEEFDALKSQVDAIYDGLKRLSNLKAAAQGAIARADLEEVEDLLSRVQEVELEEAAKTAELRAENALLRGRVDQAFQFLSAAADSFAAVDPLEPARKRILKYCIMLRNHGLRYGGHGLPLSRKLLDPVLTDDLKSKDARLWAAGTNNKAVAFQDQGIRTGGEDGTRLLAEAVTAHRNALTVRTKIDHPNDWAATQNNLGIALEIQGIRIGSHDGPRLLAEAVTAYRDALTVYTKADHPVHWAATQNNLGNAL